MPSASSARTKSRPHRIVQFRRQSSPLDVDVVGAAANTYGLEFVPSCEYHGMADGLHVYLMSCVGGSALSRVQRDFFAQGVEGKLYVSACPEFHPKLHEVRRGLPLLFRPQYPMVLGHEDPLEMNIHVEEDGHIAGLADWVNAIVTPFGTTLRALVTLVGVQTRHGWAFHGSAANLRAYFWDQFYGLVGRISDTDSRAIDIARLFGLFKWYGFDRRYERGGAGVVGADDAAIPILKAICLGQ
ncbi:hypothetical protein C8A01DRAFT_36028 [Parachaetomium inaequale]|uniref:Uncharacterized protein n=1 Tax=Parachaetomium inaequale TaxID=2588326 RepID=A0AAN6PFI5_9PEZI|nr:hypothetical protein C8A01DRAFT_36028 [Parachaetomium inaequale]